MVSHLATPNNEMKDAFNHREWVFNIHVEIMFLGQQLEKGVHYSSIQNCVWVVTMFQVEKYWLV